LSADVRRPTLGVVPFEVIYEPGVSPFAEARLWGDVTLKDFEAATLDVLTAYSEGANKELFDASGVTNLGELLRHVLSSTYVRSGRFPRGIPRAIVGPQGRSFGAFFWAVEGVLRAVGIVHRVFKTRDEAITWLLTQSIDNGRPAEHEGD
jgi:hypothetical protein